MPSGIPRSPEPREWVLKRTCTGPCGETKPWAEFRVRNRWPDGSTRTVQSKCRECEAQYERGYAAAWRDRNREKVRAYNRAWGARQRAILRAERISGDEWLPPDPFLDWLAERANEVGGWSELGERLDMEERQLFRLRYEQQRVRLSMVDRACVRLGFHLSDVYPEVYEEVA